jgi:hypothetical protein
MTMKENLIFWFIILMIFFGGFVIGIAFYWKNVEQTRMKKLIEKQIKIDSAVRSNYRKEKIDFAMTMYKNGYFFGILKHSIYGRDAFNVFKNDSINARKTIQ